MADDELWHVRISQDEIKTLTLEQIDDLYRLDVIDADTQLWQDGMDEWLPLRVVAGLDEEEHVNVSVPPSMPAPKLGSTMSSWPPAVAASPAAASSWPPPVARSAHPAAPSSRPAPPSARSAALAATVPSWPPQVSGSVRPSAPTSNAPVGLFSPSYAPPLSTRAPISVAPVKYPRPTNPMPIVLAVVVGLVITLYRNDLLHAAARTIGQEGAYLKLEEALGGPSFGTPRAVESMAKAADALPDLTLPTPTSTSRSYADDSSGDSPSSGSTKSTSGARPEPKKAAAAPQPQSAPRTVPAAAAAVRPEKEAPNPVFKQPKGAKKAKGNEFDPLNPSL